VPTIRRFEDLEAWQKARDLVRILYAETTDGPFARDFVLRDQARRSAVSIMANVAEGFERDGNKEFQQFLSMAKGSCGELRSHLYVALDQKYVDAQQHEDLLNRALEISRLIAGLIRYIRQSQHRGRKYA